MLGKCECYEDVDGVEIGVDFKEHILDSIIDNFHTVVVVDCFFISPICIEKEDEDEHEHGGSLECSKSNKREYFEQNYKFELNREPWILRHPMQYPLASNRSICILYLLFPLLP